MDPGPIANNIFPTIGLEKRCKTVANWQRPHGSEILFSQNE
jgi:hypothetical protein